MPSRLPREVGKAVQARHAVRAAAIRPTLFGNPAFVVLGVILVALAMLPRRVAVVVAGVLAVTAMLDVNANLATLRSMGL